MLYFGDHLRRRRHVESVRTDKRLNELPRALAGAALVSFRTRSHATVHEVTVYDGERQIATHTGLSLQGDHLEARFEVPGSPEVSQGINITVGVLFSPQAPDVRSMHIEVVGAGMEFFAGAAPATTPAPARARARTAARR